MGIILLARLGTIFQSLLGMILQNSTGEAFSDCAGKNFKLHWGFCILPGNILILRWGILRLSGILRFFSCDHTGGNLLDSNGDNPLSFTGDNLPKSTGDDSPNSTGDILHTAMGKISNSTGDILCSSGEYSYTPLGNIKTAGDIKPFQC